MTRSGGAAFAASRSDAVPRVFTSTASAGCALQYGMKWMAAKWITASGAKPASVDFRSAASRMSPWTRSKPGTFSRRPLNRLS